MNTKKTYFNKMHLIIAFLLFGISIVAQPVVRVPPTCNVVVAGTGVGASPGFGGQVGDGGIVCMPDSFDIVGAGGNFSYVANGTVLIGWSLRGDLSVQTTNLPPVAGVYSAGAVNPLNIESYNKNLRTAEGPTPLLPTSNTKWARSKGRVTIGYSQAPCNNSITFEVYKQYTNIAPSAVPPIIGPDCLLPNTIYTYSVDQIASDNAGDAIGFDSYYWSGLPVGATNTYYSADRSSVTFTTGATVSAFTLKCAYGRCNPWDGDGVYTALPVNTTFVTKTIGTSPVAPTFTTAPPTCLNTGTSTFNVVLTPGAIIPGYTYAWSAIGTPWLLTQNGTQNANLTVNGLDNNPGVLTLKITNGSCPPSTFTYTINRNFVAPSASISGSTCLTAGTTTNAYSIQTNAVLNPTIWTLPAGWSITPLSANGTNSALSITVPGTATAGVYTISAKSTACPGIITKQVNVRPAAPVFTSTTPNCVVKGLTPITNIAVTPVPGATGYSWSITGAPGWSITANATTANPTFVPNGTTAGPVTITVTALGTGGCNSATVSKSINYIAILTSFNPTVGFCDQYVVNSTCGSVASWVVNGTTYTTSTGNISIGVNNLSICGNGGPAITSVCANVTGVGLVCATSLGTHTLRSSTTTENLIDEELIDNVIISPNPNSGSFSINVTDFKESANATLIDFSGNEIQTYSLQKGDTKIENGRLQKGNYFVVIIIDGKQITKQLVVE